MNKIILTTVVLAGIAVAAPNAQAGIFGRWFRRAPMMTQPAPVVVAQPQTGYRAFTYQPVAAYRPVRVNQVNRTEQHQFHAAGGKIAGTAF